MRVYYLLVPQKVAELLVEKAEHSSVKGFNGGLARPSKIVSEALITDARKLEEALSSHQKMKIA